MMAVAVVIASEMGECAFHLSIEIAGIGYWNVGTRGRLVAVGAGFAGNIRMGSDILPKIPL